MKQFSPIAHRRIFIFGMVSIFQLFYLNQLESKTRHDFLVNGNHVEKTLCSVPPPDGPFLIRIYPHVIKKVDDPVGFTPAQIQGMVDMLNADFNPHNIFFWWDCVDVVSDDSKAINGALCSNQTQSYGLLGLNEHPDGIDMYLMTDIWNGGSQGDYFGKRLAVGGINPLTAGINAALTRVISHEMGHCLGLLHTFYGTEQFPAQGLNCDGTTTNVPLEAELVNGANGGSSGDWVADTPADPRACFDVDCNYIGYSYAFSGGCILYSATVPELLDANNSPYFPDATNIMSYASAACLNHFSLGQGVRMRNTISTSLTYLIAGQGDFATHITENTIYPSNRNMPGDIIVHSGFELTIEATVGMREGYRVLVERNARLKVNTNGKLTRTGCAPYWSGVQVLGNGQKAQPEHDAALNDPAQAGIVWLNRVAPLNGAVAG